VFENALEPPQWRASNAPFLPDNMRLLRRGASPRQGIGVEMALEPQKDLYIHA